MRSYTVLDVKRILGHTTGADRVFFWLAAEAGLRAGELIALRASDVDVENKTVEVSKAIWNGSEDAPKTEAANRIVCISSLLCVQVQEYLDGRTDGYLFQTSSGNPWDASNVLERKLNTLLDRLEIPKIDPKLLAKFVGLLGKIEPLNKPRGARSVRHP